MTAKALFKAVLACVCIGAIVAIAGLDLLTAVSPLAMLVYTGCAMLIVLVLAAVAIIAGQQWNLFGLNHGATDPQWMWFGGEPPGLRKEREQGAPAADAKTADGASTSARSGGA
ncbi:hypothetical protein [Variovorax sp. Root411]|uniref:hypothetical protein n=1 Tax=Variovorax sp. Root411 TaxID=1736530 RepID=UPI0006F7A9B6|nr:hypothetical protein [Variovorax sp. Root411]KQW63547.1 hypothetical protein ASC92_23550 [Variovorax sp. Root411]